MKKTLLIILIILVALPVLLVGGCVAVSVLWGVSEGVAEVITEESARPPGGSGQGGASVEYDDVDVGSASVGTDHDLDWVMYWYLCGSDLETDGGAATSDIYEIMDVDLPENVAIIIQTGGAYEWQNNFVDANKMQRFIYDSNGLSLLEEGSDANMGDVATLTDFLAFANTNYPGNQVMVNIWNHGGGSVDGVAFDERYDYDALDLAELDQAFASVFGSNPDDQPVDIIGFDACLMATLETAAVFQDVAKYMVASQEWEPSEGWYYTEFVQTMADNPAISALDLGVVICDSFQEACEAAWVGDDITLSVVNLSKIDEVVAAYNAYGDEALDSALLSSGFYASFANVAADAVNYGGNSRREGYTNMADLGDIAQSTTDILPLTAPALASALEDCVEYQVVGKYREGATGLSCFYTYSNDTWDLDNFAAVSVSDSITYFYTYGLTGQLSDAGMNYINGYEPVEVETTPAETTQPDTSAQSGGQSGGNQGGGQSGGQGGSFGQGGLGGGGFQTLPQMQTLEDVNWDDMELYIDRDGCAVLDLGPQAYDILESVSFGLYTMDDSMDYIYYLGSDNNIDADWNRGVFVDNFYGEWGTLGGVMVNMELVYEGDDFNRYVVPIYLNGEDYNLEIIYDFNVGGYSISGARKPVSDNGMADKNLRQLVNGDEISILHYASRLDSSDDDLYPEVAATITVNDRTTFKDMPLSDGFYFMYFVMTDIRGNIATSEVVTFEVDGGDIYTSLD